VLAAYPHAAGIARLRALADADRPTTVTRSGGEEVLLTGLRRAEIRTPEANVRVGSYTADFLWREEKVILELDGYHYHNTRATFERDHRRDADHQRHDYFVIRATAHQVEHSLEALLVHIALTLERRRPTAAA
jgi:very-short-patch-repair endonuclease